MGYCRSLPVNSVLVGVDDVVNCKCNNKNKSVLKFKLCSIIPNN